LSDWRHKVDVSVLTPEEMQIHQAHLGAIEVVIMIIFVYYILGKCSESVQSRAEVYVLKACDACADMGQL